MKHSHSFLKYYFYCVTIKMIYLHTTRTLWKFAMCSTNCLRLRAQIVLCSCVVYFALALYFTHWSCLLVHQNAVTVLSVWTLSHWLWPSSMLFQGIPSFFSPRHGILWLLARSRIWPNVSTNTNVRTATKHRLPALSAQLQRRPTWIPKCPRMRIGRFPLQVFNSSLRAHSSHMTN